MQALAADSLCGLQELASVSFMPSETGITERRVLPGAVRKIRKLQDLTMAQVATRGGFNDDGRPIIDHTTISRVEKGSRKIGLTQLYALAAGLGAHVDEISYVMPVSAEVAA